MDTTVDETAEQVQVLGRWSRTVPTINGFYWVRQQKHTPYVVEFEDGFAFFTGVERCSNRFSDDHEFLGPLEPITTSPFRQSEHVQVAVSNLTPEESAEVVRTVDMRERAEKAADKLNAHGLFTQGTSLVRVADIIAAEFDK